MKFYVVIGADGPPIGCEFNKAKAVKIAKANGEAGTRVDTFELCVTPREALRRLLGEQGGYATDIKTVFEIPRED